MSESTEVVEIAPAVLARFAEMIYLVPEGGGGIESLLTQVFDSKSLADLDEPWSSEGLPELPIGRMLFFTAIEKRPSDYPGGLGFYLIVDCVTPTTGKVTKYSTGAVMVVAQLVKAYVSGEFPFAGTVIEVALKNRPGMSAQHIEVDADDTEYVRIEAGKLKDE